nr:DUF424 family protein [Candidatus Sigynarchaeum springense]
MKRTVYLKVHAMHGKQFLSCCDSELLGKTFTEGKCCLRVSEGFYKGTEIGLDEASDVIAKNIEVMNSIQIIGEHIINHLHACELISKEGARRTCNVPHLILVRT